MNPLEPDAVRWTELQSPRSVSNLRLTWCFDRAFAEAAGASYCPPRAVVMPFPCAVLVDNNDPATQLSDPTVRGIVLEIESLARFHGCQNPARNPGY